MNWYLHMKLLTGVGIIALLLAGCGAPSAGGSWAGTPKLIVGALHVGSIHDLGYNQAMHDGLVEMQKNIPGLKVLEAENVPESDLAHAEARDSILCTAPMRDAFQGHLPALGSALDQTRYGRCTQNNV